MGRGYRDWGRRKTASNPKHLPSGCSCDARGTLGGGADCQQVSECGQGSGLCLWAVGSGWEGLWLVARTVASSIGPPLVSACLPTGQRPMLLQGPCVRQDVCRLPGRLLWDGPLQLLWLPQ